MRHLIFVSIPVLMIVFQSGVTRADESETTANGTGVVILSLTACCEAQAWTKAEKSIARELSLLDVPIIVHPAAEADVQNPDTRLKNFSRRFNGDAVLLVQAVPPQQVDPPDADSPRLARMYMYDRVTDKTIIKSWPISSRENDDEAMYAGLRAVDTLRASLLETRMEKALPESGLRPNRVSRLTRTTRIRSEDNRQVCAGVSGFAAFTLAPRPVLGGFETSLGWYPLRHFGLRFTVSLYPVGGSVSGAEATSDLDILSLRGWLVWRMPSKRIIPEISIGSGNLVVFAQGKDGDEKRLKDDISMIGYVGVGTGLSFLLFLRTVIRLGFRVGISIPEVHLYHDTEKVADMGHPLMEGGLTIGVMLK